MFLQFPSISSSSFKDISAIPIYLGTELADDDPSSLDRLAAVDLDAAALARLGPIGPERADLMLAGCAIFGAICALWPSRMLRVADRGLREGMLRQLRQELGL